MTRFYEILAKYIDFVVGAVIGLGVASGLEQILGEPGGIIYALGSMAILVVASLYTDNRKNLITVNRAEEQRKRERAEAEEQREQERAEAEEQRKRERAEAEEQRERERAEAEEQRERERAEAWAETIHKTLTQCSLELEEVQKYLSDIEGLLTKFASTAELEEAVELLRLDSVRKNLVLDVRNSRLQLENMKPDYHFRESVDETYSSIINLHRDLIQFEEDIKKQKTRHDRLALQKNEGISLEFDLIPKSSDKIASSIKKEDPDEK